MRKMNQQQRILRLKTFLLLNRTYESVNSLSWRSVLLLLSTVKWVQLDLAFLERLDIEEEILLPIAAPVTSEYVCVGMPYLLIGAQSDPAGNLFGVNCERLIHRFFTLNRNKRDDWRRIRNSLNWVPLFASFLAYLLYEVLMMHPFEVEVSIGNPHQELAREYKVRGLTKLLVGGIRKDGVWAVYEPVYLSVASDLYRRCYTISAPTTGAGCRIFLFLASLLLSCGDTFVSQTKKEWEVLLRHVSESSGNPSGDGSGSVIH